MKSPRLVNADIPLTQYEAGLLQEGDFVELYNTKGNLWSKILETKTRGYFDGIVSSRKAGPSDGSSGEPSFGDLISFHSRHIFRILLKDE